MTRNIKGLMNALHQSINEAILESNDVAAAMAALKRTGMCPVFTVNVSMEDGFEASAELLAELVESPAELEEPLAELTQPELVAAPNATGATEILVLSDWDVQFLATLGISDPSWCVSAPESGR